MRRNKCSQMCRNAKKHYISTSISKCSSTNIWKFLGTLGIGKLPTDTNCQFDLDLLNSFFAKPPVILDPAVKAKTLNGRNENYIRSAYWSGIFICEVLQL